MIRIAPLEHPKEVDAVFPALVAAWPAIQGALIQIGIWITAALASEYAVNKIFKKEHEAAQRELDVAETPEQKAAARAKIKSAKDKRDQKLESLKQRKDRLEAKKQTLQQKAKALRESAKNKPDKRTPEQKAKDDAEFASRMTNVQKKKKALEMKKKQVQQLRAATANDKVSRAVMEMIRLK